MKAPIGISLGDPNIPLDNRIRFAYAQETGRDPDKRFTTGIAKAQWEYGLPKTAYWSKEARKAVIALTARAGGMTHAKK